MKILYKILLCLITSLNFNAQDCDSISKRLEQYSSEVQVDSLNELAWQFRNFNTECMLYLARKSKAIAEVEEYKLGLADAYSRLGEYFRITSYYDSALYYHNYALDLRTLIGDNYLIMNSLSNLGLNSLEIGDFLASKNYYMREVQIQDRLKVSESRRARSLNRLGNLYLMQDKYDSAFFYLNKALLSLSPIDSSNNKGNVFINLANLKERQGEYSSSNLLNRKALQIFKKSGSKFGVSKVYNALGNLYSYSQSYDSALFFYKKSLKIKKELNNSEGLAGIHYNIALIDIARKELKTAEINCKKSIELWKNAGDLFEVKKAELRLGIIYFLDGKFSKAEELIKPSFVYFKSKDTPTALMDASLFLSRIYLVQGRSQEAAELIEYYSSLTVKKETTLSKSNLLEKKLLNDSYTMTLEKNLKQESDLLKKQEKINIAYIFLLILFAILIGFGLYAWQQRKKAHSLEIRKIDIENTLVNQEAKSMSNALKAQDKERKRIAQDLHDRLGSLLATVKLHFKSVNDDIEQLKNDSLDSYNKANYLLEEACDEVRKIAHDMASATLMNFGLSVALEELRGNIVSTGKIEFDLHIIGLEDRLDVELEIAIYRILQELIGNVLTHSKASHLSIQLFRKEDFLNIMIEDNGIGFKEETLVNSSGMGFRNVRTRLKELKAEMSIDSTIGKGVTITINTPLNEFENETHFNS